MSLKSKLIILILAVATVPLLFVGIFSLAKYKNSLEAARISQLRDVAALKADRIEAYFASLRRDMRIAENFYNIQTNLPVLIKNSGNPTGREFTRAKDKLDGQLRPIQTELELSDIMLINLEGKIVYSSNPLHAASYFLKPLSDHGQKAFAAGKREIHLTDLFINRDDGDRVMLLLTGPAYDSNDVIIGVIAYEIDMAPVYRIIQDATGLGDTGETLLGKKWGNEVVYLNPLRHDPDGALKRRVVMGKKTGGPIQEAVQKKNGAGQLTDYRGEKVLAVWRYLPSLDWGMVAKIDAREAFADIIHLRRLMFIILTIVLTVSGFIAFSIAQSIAVPIRRLTEGAEAIGSGRLDYKVGMNRPDEIGQLSRSFDKMTQDLREITASRDELNKEIAARKRIEESLRDSQTELKRSNENLEQFAYVASHDLQEPLRVMSSYSQLLERRYKGKLDSNADEFIAFIVDAANRMQKLITDLLAYSRAGYKDALSLTNVDCNEVLEKVLQGMTVSIQSANGTVTHGPLPILRAHEGSLVQLFQNLIGNAIKFRNSQPPVIHVAAKKDEHEWVFSFKDNGIGIAADYHEKIFHIFQRLHSKEKYPGTGIGLSICKKIVAGHGGRIWVESEPGKGAVFNFTIPER